MFLKKLLIALLCIGKLACTIAQTNEVIDAGKIKEYDTILKRLTYFNDYSRTFDINNINPSLFTPAKAETPFDNTRLEANYFIKLFVTNSSDRDTFWLYMGKALHYTMYEYDSSKAKMIQLNNHFEYPSPPVLNEIPYTFFIVKKGTFKTFYIQADVNFYNWYQFDPVIVLPDESITFAYTYLLHPSVLYIFITITLLGIMLSMFGFTLSIFIRTFSKEYLYYSCAIFTFMLYFALRLLNVFRFGELYYFFYDIRYQLLQLLGNILIWLFIMAFLKIKKNFPVVYKYCRISIAIQVIFLAMNLPLTYTNRFNYIGNTAFDVIRIFVLLCSVLLIVYLFIRNNKKEARYLCIGSLIAIIMACLALYVDRWSSYNYLLLKQTGLSVILFMTGVMLQMFLFMQGLIYRSRMQEGERVRAVEKLQLENDRKELEKYKAIIDARDNERNRISQEIHDDIGSGLTSIRLLSEIAKAKSIQEDNKELEKISTTSNLLVDKMNEIIWTLNSRNDTLPNLIAYLRHQIVEYFEPLQITLHLSIPETINETIISGKIRRNIVLSVKEALHNIVKHSRATEVNVHFEVDHSFVVVIADNGVGFDPKLLYRHNNGLHNMKERLAVIGGSCIISNHEGTSIELKVPLLPYPI